MKREIPEDGLEERRENPEENKSVILLDVHCCKHKYIVIPTAEWKERKKKSEAQNG